MMTVFEATENSISKHKKRNKVLKSEAERLLEHVLNVVRLSVFMNSLYLSGASMLIDDNADHVALLRKRNKTLRHENEQLLQKSDDVKNEFLSEIEKLNQKLQWCQKQSLDFQLKMQHQKESYVCQQCKENDFLKIQLSKYVKEIEAFKVEKLEWEKDHFNDYDKNKRLGAELQEKIHVITELKEKIKSLENGKISSKQVLASGLNKPYKTTSPSPTQTSNLNASTSTGIDAAPNVSSSQRKSTQKKNRIWKRRSGNLEALEVEDQLRNLNKINVPIN